MTVLPLTFPRVEDDSGAMNTLLNSLLVLAVVALLAAPSLIGYLHDRRIDRQLKAAAARSARPRTQQAQSQQAHTRQAQKSSSKPTVPSTATWYADGRRSKKFVSSCTP